MAAMQWGLYDTVDDIWFGDVSGPTLLDDYLLARVAAQILECRILGTDLACRIQAREYKPGGLRLRDKITPKLTAIEAIRRIEQ